MNSITEVLETIGQQSNLKYSAEVDGEKIMTEMFVPKAVQEALMHHDNAALSKLVGLKQDIICYISIPSKDKETPKDDNKPKPEDIPIPDSSKLSQVS